MTAVPGADAGASLPIRVLCRTDIDWMAAARTPGQPLPRPSSATPAFLRVLDELDADGVLDTWDDAFAVDFGAFRAALAEIAADNRAAVRNARLSVEFADFAAWYRSDEDEMIYPIDDDDYFHPDLAGTAPLASDDTAIVFWPHLVYTYDDDGRPTLATRDARNLFTNNWGVRKSFLQEHLNEQQARKSLTDHSFAARRFARALGSRRLQDNETWIDIDLESDRAVLLPESFGLSLIHVGSLLRLRRAREGSSFDHFRVTEAAEIPHQFGWVEPWIRRVERVFGSLRP